MPHGGPLRFGFGDLGAQRWRAVHPVDRLHKAAFVDDSNGHRYIERPRMALRRVDDPPRQILRDTHQAHILCLGSVLARIVHEPAWGARVWGRGVVAGWWWASGG